MNENVKVKKKEVATNPTKTEPVNPAIMRQKLEELREHINSNYCQDYKSKNNT